MTQLMMLLGSTTILIMAWLLAWSLKTSRKREFVVIGVIMGCVIGMAALSLLNLMCPLEASKNLETDIHQLQEPSEPLLMK